MPQFNLNQLRLKNFRAFTELTKINFGSRITLVFGKGSVGKSTIIDAINIFLIINNEYLFFPCLLSIKGE